MTERARPRVTDTLDGAAPADTTPAPAPSVQAPTLALLTEDVRRYGEASEIFGVQGFFGPAANKKTYGIETPSAIVPPITFPPAFLERCKAAGGQLRLHVDQCPDGSPLTMPAMHRLTAQRWGREDNKGKLLCDTAGWKASEPFYTKRVPRPGWRVVFPDIVAGTTDLDDITQTGLLIAEVTRLFQGTPMPKVLEDAIADFEARKAEIRDKMESDQWPQASEAIEGFAFSGLARPIPQELTDIMAVNLECAGTRPFENIYTRTPVRSSDGYLVNAGYFDLDGAYVHDDHPGDADPNIGASLSLQSW
ncbi:MAG: hypothetical protein V1908_03725 [Candidatus Peregrinibacteria bacterium]